MFSHGQAIISPPFSCQKEHLLCREYDQLVGDKSILADTLATLLYTNLCLLGIIPPCCRQIYLCWEYGYLIVDKSMFAGNLATLL